MRFLVLGDVMIDVDVVGNVKKECLENENIETHSGNKIKIFLGGAGNVAQILANKKISVDLYCDGGLHNNKQMAWIAYLTKQLSGRLNRFVLSGEGIPSVKIRFINQDTNEVEARIDFDSDNKDRGFFSTLDVIDFSKYDCVLLSDYCKGFFNKNRYSQIEKIIADSKIVLVNSKRSNYHLWSGATGVTYNKREALDIFGTLNPQEIANRVNARFCCITFDGDGALYGDAVRIERIPCTRIERPYLVGAGDAFLVGLGIGIVKSRDFLSGAKYAVDFATNYVKTGRG